MTGPVNRMKEFERKDRRTSSCAPKPPLRAAGSSPSRKRAAPRAARRTRLAAACFRRDGAGPVCRGVLGQGFWQLARLASAASWALRWRVAAVLVALAPLVRPLAVGARRRRSARPGLRRGPRPAASLDDDLANPRATEARALWERASRRGSPARSSGPRLAARATGWSIATLTRCALGLLLAFAAAIVAGPELYGRLAAAFDWRGEAAALAAALRVDAWIDPPP